MSNFLHTLNNMNFNILLGNLNINVVNITKVLPEKEWFVADHAHSDFEFHIIPQGKGYINIEGHDIVVNGGELYITGPLVMHRQLSDKDDPMMEYCLECEIKIIDDVAGNFSGKENYSFPEEEGVLIKETLKNLYPASFKDNWGIALKFEEIFKEAEERNAGFFIKIQTLLVSIVIDLLRTALSATKDIPKYNIPEKSVNKHRIERLLKFIEINYKNNISLSDASRVLFLSSKQINRLMEKAFSQTFHDYVLNYRFETAKKLLEETDLSIEEIAYQSGFSSHYYMYQVFKRFNSLTPAQLRLK